MSHIVKTDLQLKMRIPLACLFTEGAHIWHNNLPWSVDYNECSRSLLCVAVIHSINAYCTLHLIGKFWHNSRIETK